MADYYWNDDDIDIIDNWLASNDISNVTLMVVMYWLNGLADNVDILAMVIFSNESVAYCVVVCLIK
jgi:hypothetical protein